MHLIAPSILAADFNKLGEEIEMINLSEADWIHCDVMDGSFVPNISFGFPILKAVQKVAQKPMDVHLMIDDPDSYLKAFVEAGADSLTVHAEATRHLDRTLGAIRELGVKVGVALNPATPLAWVESILPSVDILLLMTVNPGFGGQSFIDYVLDKVADARQWREEHGAGFLIEVDGGVDSQTALPLLQAGADVLVAGSHVFRSSQPLNTISSLKQLDPLQKTS